MAVDTRHNLKFNYIEMIILKWLREFLFFFEIKNPDTFLKRIGVEL